MEVGMIIGTFVFDEDQNEYRGQVLTLLFQREIVLRALPKVMDNEPDYRVLSETDTDFVEVGAAWKRRNDRGQEFVSVSLIDPLLGTTLNALLLRDGRGAKA